MGCESKRKRFFQRLSVLLDHYIGGHVNDSASTSAFAQWVQRFAIIFSKGQKVNGKEVHWRN
jgi:hypothetical protein